MTLSAANNYAVSLLKVKRFEEAKSALRKMIPVARRVFGKRDRFTLTMSKVFAEALYDDPSATLDELREAVTMFEDIERTARQVLGGAHPLTVDIERKMRNAGAALRACETGGAREPVSTAK